MPTERNSKIDPDADFDGPDPEQPDPGRTYRTAESWGADWADMAEGLDRDILSWVPEVGDQVLGLVASVVEAVSEYGPYPLLEIDTPDGHLVQVHCFHQILKSEVERKGVTEGDRIAIRYLGREGKQDMARYRVVVQRATPRTRPADAEL